MSCKPLWFSERLSVSSMEFNANAGVAESTTAVAAMRDTACEKIDCRVVDRDGQWYAWVRDECTLPRARNLRTRRADARTHDIHFFASHSAST